MSIVASVMRLRDGDPGGPPGPHGPPPDRPPPRPAGRRPAKEPPPQLARSVRDAGESVPPFQSELPLSSHDLSLFEGTSSNAFYYVVWRRGGQEIIYSASAPAKPLRPEPTDGPFTSRFHGTLRECFHHTPMGECILVGRDIRSELADLRQFAGWLMGTGGVVLVLGLVGGWWISTQAIRPIEVISATAARISAGDLSQRIRTADAHSELGDLARVLNDTFGRLQASFARQAQFTADASHELRTPPCFQLLTPARESAPRIFRTSLNDSTAPTKPAPTRKVAWVWG